MKGALSVFFLAVNAFSAAAQQPPLSETTRITDEKLAAYAAFLPLNVERFCSYWGRGY
ncbi:MAG TPA: hypothetical protein VI730_08200 [Burkholderiales bacterium]|nr:hypothetical protein [Burkholderiales bacterium]